jgi:hypothetical protein
MATPYPSLPLPLKKDIETGTKLKHVEPTPDPPYMVAAKQAIEYVRSKCGILAANRDSDLKEWKSSKSNNRDIDDALDEASLEAIQNTPTKRVGGMMGGEVTDPKDKVAAEAAAAKKFRVGNCEMQSSVAFEFLKQFNVPLDIVYLQMYERNAQKSVKKLFGEEELARPDHVFVVVGRPKDTDVTNYGTWGTQAVVCDPWVRRAYRATNLGVELEALGTISAGQTKLGLRLRFEPN